MVGICHMQVCCLKTATKAEILLTCDAQNPSGTSGGWGVVYLAKAEKNKRPVQCLDYKDRIHVLVGC